MISLTVFFAELLAFIAIPAFTFPIHPALGVVATVLQFVVLYFLFKGRSDEIGQDNARITELLDSIANTPLTEQWSHQVKVSRFFTIFDNPLAVSIPLLAFGFWVAENAAQVCFSFIFGGACFLVYVAQLTQVPWPGNTLLTLSSDGLETRRTGLVPWEAIKGIERASLTVKGFTTHYLVLHTAFPEAAMSRLGCIDRFLACFCAGGLRHGKIQISMNYALENTGVVCAVADALKERKTCGYDWNERYWRRRGDPAHPRSRTALKRIAAQHDKTRRRN